jgi:glutamyl/glutaminyl-tRNA synthetase
MADAPITRFAPSPTGHLHVGGARTALFCWAFARRHGGRFVLRIEDTDQKRSSEDAARGILEDLAWLGIGWDDGPELEVVRLSEPGGGHGRPGDAAHRLEAGATHGDAAHRLEAGATGVFGGDVRGVGPYYQSQRLEVYQHFIDRLLEAGLAYPAFDTAEELATKRAEAQARKETYRYQRPADYDHGRAMDRMRAGEACVVRFVMPHEPVRVTDAVLGEIEFDEQHTDDFVIRKADGFPTYHFAVVVDDELMGVTHVLRGQEHLNNTPRHVALQRALTRDDGAPFRTPVYAHMPLIFNPDGSKMSKRDKDKAVRAALKAEPETLARAAALVGQGDFEAWLTDKSRQLPTERLMVLARDLGLTLPEVDVEDFRRSGYLPGVLCNYLALLGWNPGMKHEDGTDLERFDMDFLREHFSLERIGRSNSKFDRDKLAAFNQDAIAAMAPEAFEAALREWAKRYDPDLLAQLGGRFGLAARAVQPRIRTLGQCREPIAFVFVADDEVEYDEKAVQKGLRKGEPSGLELLRGFQPRLEQIEPFEPEPIEAEVRAFCEERGAGMGKLAAALRVAITGTSVSPGLGETLVLVGRDGAVARVQRALDVIA